MSNTSFFQLWRRLQRGTFARRLEAMYRRRYAADYRALVAAEPHLGQFDKSCPGVTKGGK